MTPVVKQILTPVWKINLVLFSSLISIGARRVPLLNVLSHMPGSSSTRLNSNSSANASAIEGAQRMARALEYKQASQESTAVLGSHVQQNEGIEPLMHPDLDEVILNVRSAEDIFII